MGVSKKLYIQRPADPRALLELLKPITWFPPMWAYLCGVVSSGYAFNGNWSVLLLGLLLAGPIVCGMSQAINDWCDREVDAINQPERPIPSGRVPASWALALAVLMSVGAIYLSSWLGTWGRNATIVAVIAAWIYSIEPFRLKKSGWWGPGLVGLCYEGLPWFTGAAVMVQALPDARVIFVAACYALGAHGIMTLNDFKALKGDAIMGLKSLPVRYGPRRAAILACAIMLVPQLAVILALFYWQAVWGAGVITLLMLGQVLAMRRLLRDPEKFAPWYNGTGVAMYVLGMMVAAIALNIMGGGGWV